ncbi:MAG: sulfur carrier protein ThiS [Bryobacteraceae bacterium]
MNIYLNGEEVDCGERNTIAELIERHQLSPEMTLVEHNGAALHRREWPTQELQPNDRVEILRVAAGG